MRLLVVTNDYPPKPGGIQQYLGNLLQVLPAEIRVLGPADGPADDEDRVVRSSRAFMWPTPGTKRWMLAEARAFDPDVVLFGAPHPLAWLGPTMRDELDVPYGVLCHGAEVTIPAAFPIARQLLRRPLRDADAVFAVSRFTKGRVERLTKRSVTYVGGGVDPDRFSRLERALPRGPITVGCVSRFVPRKGQLRLIRAAERLHAKGVEVELLIVGRGRQEGAIRKAASRSPVPIRIEVDVPWEQLPGLYEEMDLFCMPCKSRWGGLEIEGLGLVYLEAAATGLPVLAGDSGGSPETVQHGSTGYVVSTDDDITERIRTFDADRSLLRSMGDAGRTMVEEEFTWAATAARMHEELVRMIANT
jgi:phosphatidyl-myo-inositol dimannoside synthase